MPFTVYFFNGVFSVNYKFHIAFHSVFFNGVFSVNYKFHIAFHSLFFNGAVSFNYTFHTEIRFFLFYFIFYKLMNIYLQSS